ncbi:tumor necrosis factor receptorsuperfamily member 26 [Biomphalaria pfeifferi]|uniref:Tumor necrosis factor receptorsuperfamily member 26 n=1 Tax=Biomphalaria pfeifferi TaxID=112525 RepID=A0AAD8F0Q7_BIOPF|nr:tumor necrosis factor receptorsuperfamily member 26 [Biomphalaria pfeifferi]
MMRTPFVFSYWIFLFPSVTNRHFVIFKLIYSLLFWTVMAENVYENWFEPCDLGYCGSGERLNSSTKECVPCEEGTFIDIRNHSCLDCKPCAHPETADFEITLFNCTSVSDTVIGCREGHYMRAGAVHGMSDSCEPCSGCQKGQVLVRKCGEENDALCSANATESSPVDQTNTHTFSNVAIVGIVSSLTVSISVLILIYCCYRKNRTDTSNREGPEVTYKLMVMQLSIHCQRSNLLSKNN